MLVLVCQYSFSEIQTVTHFATLPCHWDLGIMTQYYDSAITYLGALIEDYQDKHQENADSLLNVIKMDLGSGGKYRFGYLSNYIIHKKEWNFETS
ncbi:hypothetical protein [Xenorhabdus nematophila]